MVCPFPVKLRTVTNRLFLRKPFHALSGLYSSLSHRNRGHWSPGTANSPLLRFALVLKQSQLSNEKASLKIITQHLPNQIQQGRGAPQFAHDETRGLFLSFEPTEGGEVGRGWLSSQESGFSSFLCRRTLRLMNLSESGYSCQSYSTRRGEGYRLNLLFS